MLITVFSDASLLGDTVGCGWWFKSSESSDSGASALRQEGLQINEAELWGILVAITAARRAHEGPVDLVVQCDSLAALSAIHSYGHRWAKTSKLRNGPRKNLTDFERSCMKKIRGLNIGKIWLKHVKGHTGRTDARSHINHKTDRLASEARKCLK